MRFLIAMATVGLLALPASGYAKGCIKGAVIGGVAGHFAGHHGGLGAAAGCAVGHHEANKADDARAQNANNGGNGTSNRPD